MTSAPLNVEQRFPLGTLHAARENAAAVGTRLNRHRDFAGLRRDLQLFVTEVGDAKHATGLVQNKRTRGPGHDVAPVKADRLDKRFLASFQNNVNLDAPRAGSVGFSRDLKHGFSPVSKQIKNFQNGSGQAQKPADKRFHGFLRGVVRECVGEHNAIIPRIHTKECA